MGLNGTAQPLSELACTGQGRCELDGEVVGYAGRVRPPVLTVRGSHTFNELVAVVAVADCVSTPDIITSRLMPPTSLVASAMSPWPGFSFCEANAVDAAHRIEDASTAR